MEKTYQVRNEWTSQAYLMDMSMDENVHEMGWRLTGADHTTRTHRHHPHTCHHSFIPASSSSISITISISPSPAPPPPAPWSPFPFPFPCRCVRASLLLLLSVPARYFHGGLNTRVGYAAQLYNERTGRVPGPRVHDCSRPRRRSQVTVTEVSVSVSTSTSTLSNP